MTRQHEKYNGIKIKQNKRNQQPNRLKIHTYN